MREQLAMIGLGSAWILLRSAEHLRYREAHAVYEAVLTRRNERFVRDDDYRYEVFAFLAIWCEIVALLWACSWPPAWLLLPLGAVFLAGRLRALQEVGHTALHQGFGRSERIQWAIADLFGNYMLFKPDSPRRFQSHCIGHHPNANTERDPNIVRLRAIGLVPGISRARFWLLMFHPLTVRGMAENLCLMRASLGPPWQAAVRIALNATLAGVIFWRAGSVPLLAYSVALLWLYPLFSWWSLLVEHRWWVDGDEDLDRVSYDCQVGRRTGYGALSGWLVRLLVCPLTDSYHLAHHLHPRLHWKYSPAVDRALCLVNHAYRDGASHGLVVKDAAGAASAISDLHERLVRVSR